MKTLKQYMRCLGCSQEIYECYQYQREGFGAGLEFSENEKHLFFFAINPKNGRFIVC